jgi:hypothetical protein
MISFYLNKINTIREVADINGFSDNVLNRFRSFLKNFLTCNGVDTDGSIVFFFQFVLNEQSIAEI